MLRSILLALTVTLAGCPQAGPTGPTDPNAGQPTTSAIVMPKTSLVVSKDHGVYAVAVSDDGQIVATTSTADTKNVQVWDVAKQQVLQAFDNPGGGFYFVAVSPDGKTVAYSDHTEHRVVLRDVATGKEGPKIAKPVFASPCGVFFSPKGDLVAEGKERDITGYDPKTGEVRFAWEPPDKEAKVTALSAFFDGGKKIATGHTDCTVKFWDVATGKPVQTFAPGDKDEINSLAVTDDGKLVAVGEGKGKIMVAEIASGKVVRTIPPAELSARTLCFLPDDKTLLYHDNNYDIVAINVETGAVRGKLHGHTRDVWQMARTADGSLLASVSRDGTIKIWDLKKLP